MLIHRHFKIFTIFFSDSSYNIFHKVPKIQQKQMKNVEFNLLHVENVIMFLFWESGNYFLDICDDKLKIIKLAKDEEKRTLVASRVFPD